VLAAGAWLAALLFRQVWPLVIATTGLVIAASEIADATIGGALVEISRRRGVSGRLAAAWVAIATAAELAEIPVSKLVGLQLSPWTGGLCVGLAVIVGIWALMSLELGPPIATPAPARPALRAYLRTRAFWGTVAVVSVAALARVPSSAIAVGRWPDYL